MTFEYLYRAWKSRRITQTVAAKLLGVSDRTFRRYVHRFESEGSEGLIDKRQLQSSPRRAPVAEISDVVNAYNTQHEGWNVKQFYNWYRYTGGRRSYNWVRLQLQDAGAVKRLPRRGVHRLRFDRAPLPGLRLHQDNCRHEWLTGRRCDLVVTMDDATGEHYSALLCGRAGNRSSFAGVRDVLERNGFFCALYTDRASHYRYTGKVEAAEKQAPRKLTQTERAMMQLGIRLIATRSTQVRARCKRVFETHLKRLPSELAAAGITEITAANRYLDTVYRPAYNEEFQQAAQEKGSAFEPCADSARLDDILCEQYWRVVRKDNCVRFKSRLLRLPVERLKCRLANTRVMVRRHLDDTLSISSGIRRLARYDADGKPID